MRHHENFKFDNVLEIDSGALYEIFKYQWRDTEMFGNLNKNKVYYFGDNQFLNVLLNCRIIEEKRIILLLNKLIIDPIEHFYKVS